MVSGFSARSNRRSSISSTSSADLLYSTKAFESAVSASQGKAFSVDDFELGRTIGKGRYARVRLARLKGVGSSIPLCLKILKKQDICMMNQVDHIVNEKDVLASARHPFIIQMVQTFQDKTRLYMALELVNGGELFNLLRSEKRFKDNMARFYISEVVVALEYLHGMLIAYRDIKPENILIHRTGHIKLTDFGFAKYLKGEKTYTTCGTPAYMAPEIIRGKGHGLAVDWWAAGILLFEMFSGRPPFVAQEDHEVCRLIAQGHVLYPPVMSKVNKDIITRLLIADPARRLGNPEAPGMSIREHQFFKDVDWEAVNAGALQPPWRPQVRNADEDTSLFDHFEESSGTAKSSGPVVEDTGLFDKWAERVDMREEALALAQELREAHEKKRADLQKMKDAEEARMKELQRLDDEQKRSVGDGTVSKARRTSERLKDQTDTVPEDTVSAMDSCSKKSSKGLCAGACAVQ